jgi:hypothetical protein
VRPPPQAVTEEQPFAATVAALNTSSRSPVFRAVAPVVVIAALGLGLLVWGRSGQIPPASAAALSREAPAKTGNAIALDSNFYAARQPIAVASQSPPPPPQQQPPLSLDAARSIVRSISHGTISDVRVVRTDRDGAIVALHDERREGASHMFMLERSGTQYLVTGKAALDAPDFRGATWTTEVCDVDGDGYEEVLYTGLNPRGHNSDRRLVLYVPRTRQSYALRVENRSGGQQPSRITLSPNAQARSAAAYRNALQQRVGSAL